MKGQISQMRENYMKGELDMEHTSENPIDQFQSWFTHAINSKVPEPNAVILATANKHGRPSARAMLLKEFNEKGFVFYTNKNSRKGRELSENPQAALLFFWDELERQVRIEGEIVAVSEEENDAYFYSRPVGSQFGAMASPQSQVIESRTWLEEACKELESTGTPVRPSYWGGFRLIPDCIEFWQGRPNRLHDRIVYIYNHGVWTRQRLAP